MKHKGYNNVVSSNGNALGQKNKMFQGQMLDDDLGLNWYAFKWRNHDPAIGRFFNIDPLAEDYAYNSTYAFAENKLGLGIELEGLELFNLTKHAEKNGWGSWGKRLAGFADAALNNANVLTIAYSGAQSSSGSMQRISSGEAGISDYTNAFIPFSGLNANIGLNETAGAALNGNEAAQGSLAYMAVDLAFTGKIFKTSSFKPRGLSVADDVVYRGDTRSPDVIFGEGGFTSKGSNFDLLDHVSGIFDDSAYISTSKSLDVAKGFAGPDGYVYTIKKSGGIDINAKLGDRSPFPLEQEVAFPLEISREAIIKAQRAIAE